MSKSTGAADSAERPQQLLLTAASLVAAGVMVVIGSATLYLSSVQDWLRTSALDANAKLDKPQPRADVLSSLGDQRVKIFWSGVVLMVALLVAAAATWRGKYWARWAVVGLWVLATFTGTLAGLNSLLIIASGSVPLVFRVPVFLAALAFIAAVVLVNLRPTVTYLNRSRPARPEGAPERRGLFAPRPPATSRPGSTSDRTDAAARPTRPARTRPAGRAAAPAEAEPAAAANGTDRRRPRATSKSRRTGD